MSIPDEAPIRNQVKNSPDAALPTMRCPTCGAAQSWASECRRCKCDLSLVVAALRQAEQWARQCCRLLREERFAEAEAVARRLAELDPSEDAARYLAVCRLMRRRFQSAIDLLHEVTCGSDSLVTPTSSRKL